MSNKITLTNKDAIKILSILHLGHPPIVKVACDMAIKSLQKDEERNKVFQEGDK